MAILHGSWIINESESCLFIWAETWRKIEPIDTIELGMNLRFPLAMSESELKSFLISLHQSGKLNWLLPETSLRLSSVTAETPQEKGKKNRRSAKNHNPEVTAKNSSIRHEIQAIALPTQISTSNINLVLAQHSAATFAGQNNDNLFIFPWEIEGLCLNPEAAFIFLQTLPLNSTETDSFVGSDLRFWSYISRWTLDLLARCKFLPALDIQSDGSAIAKWQPLLDSSTDQLRLATFSKQMPTACRTYQGKSTPPYPPQGGKEREGKSNLPLEGKEREGKSTPPYPPQGGKEREEKSNLSNSTQGEGSQLPLAVDLPVDAQELILGFLSSVLDSQVRSAISSNMGSNLEIKTVSPTREWLQSLQQESGIVQAESAALEKLATKLSAWTAPLQNSLSQKNQFRTCFQLIPPSPGKTEWSLNYCLQAVEENDFLVDARTVWNNSVESLNYAGRTIQLPQETLLSGLGLASKLYPLIEPSLQAQRPHCCLLKPLDAYNFIKSVAWRFTDSGLGVVLPPSLSHTDGWASRLGLSIQAETTPPNPPLVRGGAPEINPPLLSGGAPEINPPLVRGGAPEINPPLVRGGAPEINPPLVRGGAPEINPPLVSGGAPEINPPLVRGGKGGLGLQSLLSFKWELTIGGQRISKAEFDRLVGLNSPLVEINGEWVELRAPDVRAAQTFFASRKEQMTLSLEDALRLANGDSQTIEKLPVVNFEASGQLQELLNTLNNNEAVSAIEPASFRGKLRPYQALGVGWLAFLERWGLGACLADDMGCGKCILPQNILFVNGFLQKAAQIWEAYAGKTEFDGEGFWAEPNEQLLVNSINQETGKIVEANIRRLYRQQVQEKLRTIKLQDGSNITITRRHKLLGRDGWTNEFKVGDYVCVPAKLYWEGKPEDPDLVKFLAWQIAEGYEQRNQAALKIAQKDATVLEELRVTLHRISTKYGIKINNPAVRTPGKQRLVYLSVCSREYQTFLESKGYEWGKLSAEKSFPQFIMQANLDSIRIFLKNYFDAEGSVLLNTRNIEISSVSPLLMQQLSTLLRRFGIWLRISAKQKRATNGSGIFCTYYIGTFGGNSVRIFLDEIGFGYPEKQRKLELICEATCNTNVEGIPVSDIVASAVEITKLPLRHLGMHNPVYINGSQQFSHTSLTRVVGGMDNILDGSAEQEYRQLKLSKWTNQTLEAYANLDTQQLQTIRQSLQVVLDQEVFYCRIEEIEDFEYEGWVYDFEVGKHHNFVANNILCHNTVQLIGFLLHLQENNSLEWPTLLVCPTSVLGNWEREVKKFGPTLKVLLHHGEKRAKGKAFATAIKGKDLIITSYSLVFRDAKEIQNTKWQGLVLDEAQNIKNSESQQSKIVRQIETSFKIALTGTPVENRLQELWSILEFLNPGYLGARNFFQRRFAIPIEKYGDRESLQSLRSLVRPFILRRLKTDKSIIQDLPEKQEMTVFCGLATEQAILYQQIVEKSIAELESAEGIQRRGMILALLVRLKQLCNHPALLTGKENPKSLAIKSQESGKLQRLLEMLEEVVAEGDRSLIFTQFAEWGKLLKPHLEKHLGREVLFLYGGIKQQQREEMIDRFQHDPQGPPIMILSLKAGGTGLNLTRATHVFHYDRWWNPAVENQATDRVFRIGQTRNVQVHKFVCTGTLEEKIHDMIESKKALAEQVVSAGENWITELDTDQLRNLLILDRNAIIESSDEE
ncbi:SNF2-related protein [Microcoleus sp. EPA2]|uniref:SNF2-related protein n=1 Tax=Microcoleus sp. EPA2 TaxID=2841654 RepID=UPI00312B5CF1